MPLRDDEEALLLLEGTPYLFRQEFLTPGSAPLTAPVGFAIQDTANVWSNPTGGEIVPSGQSVGSNNPGIWRTTGLARVSGRAMKARVKNVSAFGIDANKTFSPMVVWDEALGTGLIGEVEGISYFVVSSKFQVIDGITGTSWSTIEPCLADTYNDIVSVLRTGGGSFPVVDGKLIGVLRQNTVTPLYAAVSSLGGNRNPPAIKYLAGKDLPSPWNSDFGICTTQLPGARSAADTFTHEADGHIEFTITTLPASGNVLIPFRRQDANNHYRINVGSTGTVAIEEVVAGTPTTKVSITSCQANDRMVVTFKGSSIALFRDRPATGVTNTTLFTTAIYTTQTAGQVNSLGTGGAISDLYTYPYNLSGAALALVNAL